MEKLLNIHGGSGGSSGKPGMPAMPELAKMMGLDPDTDMRSLGKQADNLWKFLDDLAESDPAGYKEFLQQQAKAAGVHESQRATRDEAPAAVLEAVMASKEFPDGALAMINLWAAKDAALLPPATVGGDKQPVSPTISSWSGFVFPLGQTRKATVRPMNSSMVCEYHLICNPDTAALLCSGTPPVLRSLAVEAMCQFVEKKYGAAVQRATARFKVNQAMLSDLERDMLAQQRVQAAMDETASSGSRVLPQSLAKELSHMSLSSKPGATAAAGVVGLGLGKAPAAAAKDAPKKPLIVDLSAPPPSAPEGQDDSSKVTIRTDDSSRCVTAEVLLPPGIKASDVDMEVVGLQLQLTVSTPQGGGQQSIQATLPCPVDCDAAVAKLDKKTGVLTVRLPMMAPGS